MPRKDVYHDVVIQALMADGWTITHDPLPLSYGGKDVYVDLGAAQPIGAEKADCRIAVEIKSFLGPSDVHELEVAIGQYALYQVFSRRSSRIARSTWPLPSASIRASSATH
jgi:hypothetical protein